MGQAAPLGQMLYSVFAALSCASVGLCQGLAPRQDVLFEVTQATPFGSSVFVVGDLPELGSNSNANAIKLSPAAYPTWRATLSLPADRTFSYRFITRLDGPGQQNSSPSWTSASQAGTTASQPRPAQSKALWLTWNIDKPVLWWRSVSPTFSSSFQRKDMEIFGPAVEGRTNEKQWLAWNFHIAGEAFDFYFTDSNGNFRYPATGFYSTNLDGVFVQDGQLYTYVPSANPQPARRDYNPSAPPSLYAPTLDQTRNYRVFLPRGYDAHPHKRYPVVYIHDGQNIFDQGSFGTWNAATTLADLQASGRIDEVIAVGLDNIGTSRRSDYSAPGDNNGRADLYAQYVINIVKPHIDTGYRTLTDAANTASLGSSMGGVVSFYLGYQRQDAFSKVGSLSTAWWLVPNFTNFIKSQPAQSNLRIYMDVGDSGSTSGGNNNDGYWDSFGVRDNFIGNLPAKYSLSGQYAFAVGFGQNHSEGAWASRLPNALVHLFPSQIAPNELLSTRFAPNWDRTRDAHVNIEDLYHQNATPADLTFDGRIDEIDSLRLEAFIRRQEAPAMKPTF